LEAQFYIEYAILEDKHWWFIGRRRIIEKILNYVNFGNNPDILEVGCGTGGNLSMLSKYGNIYALESNERAIEIANNRGITKVEKGSLPDNIPFKGQKFDLIVMFDVLEHIEDDLETLRILKRSLKPYGKLLLTVPAYQFLWSHQDDICNHKRRYIRRDLEQLINKAGFSILYSTYFNTILFPIVVIVRMFKNVIRSAVGNIIKIYDEGDFKIRSKTLNRLLIKIFSFERHMIPWIVFPFGVSIMLVAQSNS
jgi:SAM-dependent methyltransferase